MVDGSGRKHLVNYGSSRCHRVTRSVMESEIHALVLGFDVWFIRKDLIADLIERDIPIEEFVDSRTVFNVMDKKGNNTERRF